MADSVNTAAPAAFDFAASGKAFALAEGQRGRLIAELGENLKGCDYAHWIAARDLFVAGAKAAGWLAADKLWVRVVSQGQELGLIPDTPKAQTPAATKAAAKRSAKVEAIAKLQEGATPAELRSKAAAELGKGAKADTDAAALMLEAAKRAEADAAKAAKDKANEATKARREAITAAVKRMVEAADLKGLDAVLKVALKHSPAPADLPAAKV